ncbi:MAG: biosynthetic peptidoglycan transglycosylase, partial [Myxococcota bacterium]
MKSLDIELKDRYRIHISDINISERSARISFKDMDIPFLLDRYIGRYSNLIGGRLEGSVIVRKVNQELQAKFSDISVLNMSANHPLIGESPFKIRKFLINGRISLSLVSGLLRFDEIDINISDIKFTLSGRFFKGSYSLRLNTESARLNDLAAFFGGEEFEGFDMRGEIKVALEVTGNINDKKKIDRISISGDIYKPVQISHRLNYLKSDFSYDFMNKGGKKRKIVVGTQNPDYLSFSEIPQYVYGAVVSSEDAGFFGHKGVEFKEIESAIIDNIEGDKPYLRGGSTITQQLVKNLLLSREKTLLRKVKELLLSIELDATLSKERILEIYLNGIEWGPEIFG